MSKLAKAIFIVATASFAMDVGAQSVQSPDSVELPVTKVVLFTSGVGYFEHRGQVTGDSVVSLPFEADEVNDAIKSLVVSDGSAEGEAAASPSVSYPSRESLDRALKEFRIDLSGSPGMADILARIRGAEISVDMPETITGRIVAIEQKPTQESGVTRPYVVLLTAIGLKSIALDDVQTLRFTDKRIEGDFERALALILGAHDERDRSLDVRLPGSGTRKVAIGYVIAAPVWKASYRLDLSPEKPRFQGWAIVDNPTNQDWTGVALSLVSGRPVSFIQDLYEPLYLDRPILPLAIAGIAAAHSFDSGFTGTAEESDSRNAPQQEKRAKMAVAAPTPIPPSPSAAGAVPSGESGSLSDRSAFPFAAALEATRPEAAGDQFQFTVEKPVSLGRGRSAMLPLVASDIAAERVSIFSPDSKSGHPMLGVRLVNTTGIRLPAGPIVVFDGDIYAGDALLDFFPEKDSRLIVYGEDLGVVTDVGSSVSQETIGVTIVKGVMTFSRRVTFSRSYSFKNGTAKDKKIVIEHPITPGSELFEPTTSDEKTQDLYRFSLNLPAAAEAKLVVEERSPRQESVTLGGLGPNDFLAYLSSQELPKKVRDALKGAVELRGTLEDAKRSLANFQARKESLAADQARYRSNLESVGRDSSQGQQYLKRIMDSESAIDQTSVNITEAQKKLQEAQSAYDGYLSGLNL
jgi:hypothetical protein